MRKTPILVTCLASVVLGTLASVSADAATSRKWWMRDWNCTNAHQQKMQIKSQIIDDMECNEDYCTVSSDAVAILKWRLVDGAGSVSFRVTNATSTSVSATDRPDGGDTELNLIVQFKENGHERAAGTMTSAGSGPSDIICTTGSFASLEPLVVRKPGSSAGKARKKHTRAKTGIDVVTKAEDTTPIFSKAKPKLEIPDIAE